MPVRTEPATEKLAASVGRKVESMYYAFGDCDVFVIVDAPDNACAAARDVPAINRRISPFSRFYGKMGM